MLETMPAARRQRLGAVMRPPGGGAMPNGEASKAPATKQGWMQIGSLPQQVTLTQAQPGGHVALEAQLARPAQDCGKWQNPTPSTVWKQTHAGSWQPGKASQVPPGQVTQVWVAQQSQAACWAAT